MKLFRKKGLIFFVVPILLLTLIFGVLVLRAYGSTDRIAAGVSAGGIDIGKLSVEDASNKLYDKLKDASFDKPIYIVFDDVEKKVIPESFLASYDYRSTAEKAAVFCREGNFIERIKQAAGTFFTKKDFALEVDYDEVAYEECLAVLMEDIGEKIIEHSWEIVDNKLIVTTGAPGLLPDIESVSESIIKTISERNYDEKIVFKKEVRNPKPLTAAFLCEEICTDAENAYYEINDGRFVMYEHSVGIKFDLDNAEQIIAQHSGFNETFEIPLTIEQPSITTKAIEEELFAENLGEFQTKFNTGDVARSKNIALASNKINGTILAPDEVFSYNGVVGERSYSEGFQTAKVYVNGETVDGIGGGICQVSSTLFNAVVYANLEIVERLNHQLTVSYVPLGRDATVDYGNIDFKFRNNTGSPIKVVCSSDDGIMYVAIYGRKPEIPVEVSFETAVVGHTPPPERKTEDPTLPLGEIKIEKPGSSGYIVDTYKIIKRPGEEAEKVYMFRSKYNGSLQYVLVGTGEAVPSPSPDPTSSPFPLSTDEPSPTDVLPTDTLPTNSPGIEVPSASAEVTPDMPAVSQLPEDAAGQATGRNETAESNAMPENGAVEEAVSNAEIESDSTPEAIPPAA